MSVISVIVGMDEHRAIGKDRQLLWHLPHDMQHFKEITTGHTVIMGRKTFESLPKGALPNRKNIVLTQRFAEAKYENCLVCPTLQSALAACENEEEVFIIGGANVYRQAMAIADKLYLTTVHHTFAGADTFFPPIDAAEWVETDRQDFPEDDKNPHFHSFSTYIRKNNGRGGTTIKN
ncbi:MAG: dihydrofolate reductase [Tannerella sp.]|jgi:dihydrofolate reductase|nr:dihydrofolate reductase [Tannerella sp.]